MQINKVEEPQAAVGSGEVYRDGNNDRELEQEFLSWKAQAKQQLCDRFRDWEPSAGVTHELAAAYCELQEEIDTKAYELGLPSYATPAPQGTPTEIARRLVAVQMAAELIPPIRADETLEEARVRLIEAAEQLISAGLRTDEEQEAEARAREELAELYEREGRGGNACLEFARRLRRQPLIDRKQALLSGNLRSLPRAKGRTRERKASGRRTSASRGDPPPDEGDLPSASSRPVSRQECGSGAPVSPREAALVYQRVGLSVIPTYADKRPHSKALRATGASSSWKRFRDQPAAEAEISAWYESFPDAGVAILTGRPSNLVVLDFDGPLPRGLRIPVTPIVKTARGLHVYLRSAAQVATSKFRGGDLKAEGGYVVAPPSSHLSGKQYQWLIAPEGLGTLRVPEASFADYAEWEQWGREEPAARHEEEGNTGVDIYACVPSGLTRPEERKLADWDADPAFVEAARLRLGIPHGEIGRAFCCVLPLREDVHPSASLYVEPLRQRVVYRDWRSDAWYTLTEVYAAQVSGRVRKLGGPEHARWKLRLLVELGVLSPAPVAMPPLPADAPPRAVEVYKGFRLLLACRWIREPAKPAPFTGEFGAGWCGLSLSRFKKGKGWLIERKLIQPAGSYLRMRLWLPGESEAA